MSLWLVLIWFWLWVNWDKMEKSRVVSVIILIIIGIVVGGVVSYFVFSGGDDSNQEKVIFNDEATGLTVNSIEGLVPSKYTFAKIVDEHPIVLTNNEITLPSDLVLYFSGIEGYIEEGGKIFIEASMQVLDSSGKMIVNDENMFSDYEISGIDSEDGKVLTFRLSLKEPIKVGETYTWKTRIWDLKGEGEIISEVKLKIVE